jgi:pimeloyl-ACP methyl ester carboxylesterase|tara:strand:+ start:1718 stop:2767 length:1050 start_codon:yes stop_codon:yes gene_type:complete
LKTLKKTLLIVVAILVILIISAFIYINLRLPKLPALTNKIIEKALVKEQRKIAGKQGYAQNDSTKIWYNSITPTDSIRGNIILIMGIANDALAWPDYFIKPLVDSGYRVIRFDNRGTGMSDWNDDWSKSNAYSLDDMADDAISILDTLNIHKVHVIGVSLGGMIAQTLSIKYPDRVITLTSMMSTGDIMDKELPSMNKSTVSDLMLAYLRYGLIKTETNQIKLRLTARLLLMGDEKYDLDISDISNSVLHNLRNRQGYNQNASKQHIAATYLSGSRYDDLTQLTTPTLIIHGTTDPLIDFEHGKKCYEIIPNAQYLWIVGMGHDIPPNFTNQIILGIVGHINSNSDGDE